MSLSTDCGLSEAVHQFASDLFNFSYTWLTALYFFIGMFGNVALLIAFYKQSKEDGAYVYQVYLTVSKTLEVLATSAFNIFHNTCSGADVPGYVWYMRNYFGMFMSAYILCPLSNWFMISSLFCTVAMTADRVFALSKPFVYININNQKHQWIAGTLSFVISFLINLYDCWHWYVFTPADIEYSSNATYLVVANEKYLESELGIALSHVRTSIRLSSVVALVVLNVTMAIIFRQRTQKTASMTKAGDPAKEKQRKAAEHTLMILTVWQSVLILISNVPHSAHFVAIFTWPTYTRCYITIFGPIVDDLIMIADAADFFIIILVNQRMRRMILKIFPGRCGMSTETVAGTTTSRQSVSSRPVEASVANVRF